MPQPAPTPVPTAPPVRNCWHCRSSQVACDAGRAAAGSVDPNVADAVASACIAPRCRGCRESQISGTVVADVLAPSRTRCWRNRTCTLPTSLERTTTDEAQT